MKITYLYATILVGTSIVVPSVTYAADPSLQGLIVGSNDFINSILIPAVLAIAFFIFVVNVVRFFIIGGANEEGQKNAKALALYSIGAFVFILIFWGIVNLLTSSLGLENDPCDRYTTSDYIDRDQSPCTRGSGSVDAITDDGDFVQPVVPTDPNEASPNVTTPSNDDSNPPRNPPQLPDITSFTPDGDAFVADPGGQTAEERLTDARRAVRAEADDYFGSDSDSDSDSDMELHFGRNTNLVQSALMADLHTLETSLESDENRLNATYRLVQLGAIPQSIFDDYLDRYNTAVPDADTLSAAEVANAATQPVPLTRAAEQNIDETIDVLRAEVDAYNERIFDSVYRVEFSDLESSLYDTTEQISVRRQRFEELYNDNGEASIIADDTRELYERFNSDLNMEAAFAGEFNAIK